MTVGKKVGMTPYSKYWRYVRKLSRRNERQDLQGVPKILTPGENPEDCSQNKNVPWPSRKRCRRCVISFD